MLSGFVVSVPCILTRIPSFMRETPWLEPSMWWLNDFQGSDFGDSGWVDNQLLRIKPSEKPHRMNLCADSSHSCRRLISGGLTLLLSPTLLLAPAVPSRGVPAGCEVTGLGVQRNKHFAMCHDEPNPPPSREGNRLGSFYPKLSRQSVFSSQQLFLRHKS